jgi:TolB-like protein/DNA-binding SARP family transcriptional activator/lipopolysaccharide biosynthesis regulator YciM
VASGERLPIRPVSIKFLGRCELRSPVGDGQLLTNAKTALLLARLAMPLGQAHDRKRLTELLWPDRGEPQASASLRQSLWTLRKAVGEDAPSPIIADRSSVRLDPAAVEVDTMVFERLIRSGTTDDLARAAEIYHGDYLSEVDLEDEDSLAVFLFERQRLRELALSGLKSLIGMRIKVGEADAALEIAHRALTIDPLQEDIHAAIIRLHRDRGRPGLARDQYEACREILRRELDIAPSAEIEALRKSLGATPERSVAPDLAGPMSPPSPPAGVEPSPPRWTRPRPSFLAAGLAAIAVLLLAFYLFQTSRSELPLHTAVADTRPSLLVLPFEDTSTVGPQVAFAAGLTDSLITDLSKVSGLFVIAAETSRLIAGRGVPAEQQAAKLGVGFAVKGTVQRSPNGVQVAVELVRAGTGAVIWAKQYERQGADLFEVQFDIVRRIAASLAVDLSDRERRIIDRVPTRNLEAQDYYQRAEYQVAGLTEAESFRRALTAYRRAFELDPDFAEAYAGYARIAATVWRRDYSEILSSAVARHEAYDAAGKAMQLDPENARAYEVLSIIQAVEGEHQLAVDSAHKAVDFQPGDAEAHANLATVLFFAGDLDGAAAEVSKARKLNPALSTDLRLISAMVAFAQHHYPIAIAEFNAIRESVQRSDLVLEHLAAAYAYLGDIAKAKAIVSELKEVLPITNLGYYAVLHENIGTPEQTAHFIEGLRRAGIPEWPFNDRRREEDRLSSDELRALIAKPTWKGKLANGVDFVQYFDHTGSFAYGSTTSLLTGRVEIRDGQLCQIIEGYLLNRPSCGYVFRNDSPDHPTGTLAYVSIDAAKYFTVLE